MIKKFVFLVSIMLTGCSTITIQPEQTAKYSSEPTYEESKHFFLWGIVGEHRVNVTEICGNREVIQMQSQQTFVEGVLGLITLGIYSPHSVKVWCSEAGEIS
ncbi:Bor family protein [Thalassotalea mangrovi]|uniref:Bor family protein n=1 Tax=Thalassotalea mangrovi TaxID=2572245 RepID=A0A4U1B3Z9_9GAMM|nr:Bor family protein [Thalassotalea mangrovi]TKB44633.1 Bor family protein [Thalassotalea mangrovi]